MLPELAIVQCNAFMPALREVLPRVLDILTGDDVVAVEDGPGLVPGDLLRYLPAYPLPLHIPNSRPSWKLALTSSGACCRVFRRKTGEPSNMD